MYDRRGVQKLPMMRPATYEVRQRPAAFCSGPCRGVVTLERHKSRYVSRLYRPAAVERAPGWLPAVSTASAVHLAANRTRPVVPPAPEPA